MKKGATDREGELVTVKIPAGLIPLRYYDIDTEGTTPTMTIGEALPVRVFYSVGPKTTILTSKGNIDPTKVDADFLASNTVEADSGDKLKLYSNAYNIAPRVGAWIETLSITHGLIIYPMSLPAWERGLKPAIPSPACRQRSGRSPRGSVD